MDKKLVEEIIACLPQDRTLFHYYRDRYAVYLLARFIEKKQIGSVSKIKQTGFAKYLAKPAVGAMLASLGKRELNAKLFEQCWPCSADQVTQTYRLSLGSWGEQRENSWQQTSRRGSNLVLQINFTTGHDSDFKAWTGIETRQAFNYFEHPVSSKCDNTLAWSRLDVDFETGTVLIEEIQTDWLRRVEHAVKYIRRESKLGEKVCLYGVDFHSRGLLSYEAKLLRQHRLVWAEAMMLATIWFIHHELGIDNIFYHTAETGAALKNLQDGKPPRSLYSELPRKFCFEKTELGPAFLSRCAQAKRRLKKVKQPTWYKLAV